MVRSLPNRLLATCLTAILFGCAEPVPEPDADVIVIGAGIAGLSAALEASDRGARVLVLDMNSVGGGHAVMAGGLFLVGTPLQAKRGVADSPELAYRDIMAWGEDGDADWVRRYVNESRAEVHDWLTQFGVEFSLLLPAPGETSVPRFHFARGAAVNVVVPMMRAVNERDGIEIRYAHEVVGLERRAGGVLVSARELRTNTGHELFAPAVIVATGGFESDLDRVRANWLPGVARPGRLLAGAGRFARGSGLELAAMTGAAVDDLHKQTIFVTGFPDPRDPEGRHGLLAQNPAALFVNADGERFVNEEAPRKTLEKTVLGMPGQTYWMIFDGRGVKRLQVRGAPWLTRDTQESEILANPSIVQRADRLEDLAAAAGLPADALMASVDRFNELTETGEDADFQRFGANSSRQLPKPLVEPPFYALQLYPMTRKSMGGLQIDDEARVLDDDGQPIAGLFAAGEVTGVAGINGSHGGSGTFLGPSVLTGRTAGRAAARTVMSQASGDTANGAPDRNNGDEPQDVGVRSDSRGEMAAREAAQSAPPDATSAASPMSPGTAENQAWSAPRDGSTTMANQDAGIDPGSAADGLPADAWRYLDSGDLAWLLEVPRAGYWHFEQAHALVIEQARDCAECHGPAWPTRQAQTRNEKRVQLESCTRCH